MGKFWAVLLVLASARVAAAAPFTIEDLEALARHHSWDEVLAHKDEIPDDKRGPAWHDVVERAAVGVVGAAEGGALGQLAVAEFYHQQLPLDENGPFEKKFRALVGELARPATAWQAAQVAGKSADAETAIHLFTIAFGGKADASKCADKVAGEAIVRGLGYSAKEPTAVHAHALAVACYAQVADALRAELWRPDAGPAMDYFINVCGLLKSHQNLSGLQARECKS